MPSDIFKFYASQEIDGLVIEAMGQGNLPPTCLDGLNACIDKNIPIVIVSRSFNGIVSPVYAYEGGGYQLAYKGLIFSNGLNGPKARLKLLVSLSNELERHDIRQYFEE